jgi:Protein of unknown function (DUF3179)
MHRDPYDRLVRYRAVLAVLIVLAAACTAGDPSYGRAIARVEGASLRNQLGFEFPAGPQVITGPADPALVDSIESLLVRLVDGVDIDSLEAIGESNDARAAWLIADLLRLTGPGDARSVAADAFESLTETSLDDDPVAARSEWQSMTDHLIAWDLPPLPGYAEWKGQLFTLVEPKWGPFFADENAEIDWRLVTWGGVLLDDRVLGEQTPCMGCIPALDEPTVTDADGGDWYPDDRYVFGVTVDGEWRAYPKHIMEVHEMVNDTLGGRRIGIPYCTLCGSAQAYFTDAVPEGVRAPVLRTSGLLIRSNKVMFDLNTYSLFDTFTGVPLSGRLLAEGVVLEQISVVTSTWGEWKAAHPTTTIVAEDGGIGRKYALDPLGGRDDDGPIFPVGDVDGRLAPQEKVLGVFAEDGAAVAFPVVQARAELQAGRPVRLLGIELIADGSGVRATDDDRAPVVGHEAFWFAWSQFHPDTLVWAPHPEQS